MLLERNGVTLTKLITKMCPDWNYTKVRAFFICIYLAGLSILKDAKIGDGGEWEIPHW